MLLKLVATMANKFDDSEWKAALTKLKGPQKESIARRMAVAGARVLRDEARVNAEIADNKEGVPRRGLLADMIYAAYDQRASAKGEFSYNVSWRRGLGGANHGHLVEFGHWRTHVVYKAADGEWYSDPKRPLATPVWVAARPFLRPAYDSKVRVAIQTMIETGKRELPDVLKE